MEYILWWSALGTIPYCLFVLPKWSKTRRYECMLSDVLRAMPFGVITTMAAFITWLLKWVGIWLHGK